MHLITYTPHHLSLSYYTLFTLLPTPYTLPRLHSLPTPKTTLHLHLHPTLLPTRTPAPCTPQDLPLVSVKMVQWWTTWSCPHGRGVTRGYLYSNTDRFVLFILKTKTLSFHNHHLCCTLSILYHCFPLYTIASLCIPLPFYTIASLCIPLLPFVYHCFPLYTTASLCTPLLYLCMLSS